MRRFDLPLVIIWLTSLMLGTIWCGGLLSEYGHSLSPSTPAVIADIPEGYAVYVPCSDGDTCAVTQRWAPGTLVTASCEVHEEGVECVPWAPSALSRVELSIYSR
jgi:hypothetical protein